MRSSLSTTWLVSLTAAIACPTRSFVHPYYITPRCSNIMSKRLAEPATTKQQSSLSSFFQPPPKRTKVTGAATSSTDANNNNKISAYIIYCDLDGVLVDFDAGVKKLFPKSQSIDEIPSKVLWPTLAKATGFYRNLPWMSDGKQLWKVLVAQTQSQDSNDKTKLQLRILTGCPMFHAAAVDKYQWCRRELGVDATIHIPRTGPKNQQRSVLKVCDHNTIQVVTCRSKEKYLQSGKGCVLIDDRLTLKADWEQKGGVFIHHTSTKSTLQQLRDKGILTVTALPAEADATAAATAAAAKDGTAAVVTETKTVSETFFESEGTDDEEY